MSRWFPLALAMGTLGVAACNRAGASRVGASADAAEKVYVAPGKHDELYAFMSGGFDGQVGIYGLPSERLLRHVPVFSQNPENGWGYSEQTKAMLTTSYGPVPWDDAHHPQLSQTAGVPDGRWLFINGNNTPRIALGGTAPVALRLRGGGTYNHIELEDESGATIGDSGHGFGWEAGAALGITLGSRWELSPGARYRSLSPDLDLAGVGTSGTLEYVALEIGVSRSF